MPGVFYVRALYARHGMPELLAHARKTMRNRRLHHFSGVEQVLAVISAPTRPRLPKRLWYL
jgi:hypothetical protein